MSIFKILAFIWPFLWEMVLGKMTLRQALRNNKKKVAFVIFIAGSLMLNVWTVFKDVTVSPTIAADRRDKEDAKKERVEEPTPVTAPPHSVTKEKEHDDVVVREPVKTQKIDVKYVNESLDKIIRLEDQVH